KLIYPLGSMSRSLQDKPTARTAGRTRCIVVENFKVAQSKCSARASRPRRKLPDFSPTGTAINLKQKPPQDPQLILSGELCVANARVLGVIPGGFKEGSAHRFARCAHLEIRVVGVNAKSLPPKSGVPRCPPLLIRS